MSASFDPYHKWLGIPPKDQPPHYYRLLGVELLESDLDVIENAADQRMRHIRSFQNGPHSADSQRLLNEISAAKIVLLDPEQKARYDQHLRSLLAATTPQNAPAQPHPHPYPQHYPQPNYQPDPQYLHQPSYPSQPQPNYPQPTHPQPIPAQPLRTAQPLPARPIPVAVEQAAPAETPGNSPEKPKSLAISTNSGGNRRSTRKKDPRKELAKHVAASVTGLAMAFVILGFLREDWDKLGIARSVRGVFASAPETPPKSQPRPPSPDPSRPEPGATKPKHEPGATNSGVSQPSSPGNNGSGPMPNPPMPNPMPNPGGNSEPQTPDPDPPKPPTPPQERQPVPDEAALATAREELAAEIQGGDAVLLLEDAELRPPAERYILIAAARDKHAAAGALGAALSAARTLSQAFEVDPFDAVTETLTKVREGCATPEAFRDLASETLKHYDEGLRADRGDVLERLALLALGSARESQDVELARRATRRLLEARQLPVTTNAD